MPKFNEKDLNLIFEHQPLPDPDRLSNDCLKKKFSVSGDIIDDAIRCGTHNVTDPQYDHVRLYKEDENPCGRKVLGEQLGFDNVLSGDELGRLVNAVISCVVLGNDQLQEIKENRPPEREFTALDLARMTGARTKAAIKSRAQQIDRLWAKRKRIGSTDPKYYLKNKIVGLSIGKVEAKYVSGASTSMMAREIGVFNQTITDFWNRLKSKKPKEWNALNASRNKARTRTR